MELFFQQLFNGLVIGSTYAVVAIGFALVFTVLRVINFAHPDIFMIGMFAGLFAGWKISDSFIVVAAAGAVGALLVGLLLERAVLRPLRGREPLMTMIGTLGVGIVLQYAASAGISPDPVAYPHTLARMNYDVLGISMSTLQLVNFGVSILILAAISFFVRVTRYGRATRAIAERPDVAAAFGVDVNRVSQVAVGLSSAMAGLAAVSVGMLYGSAHAFVGLLYGLKAFICMLVAGNRYFEGVMAVALVLGIVEALVTGYISSSLRDAVAFVLLISVLYFRPNGLFGSYSS